MQIIWAFVSLTVKPILTHLLWHFFDYCSFLGVSPTCFAFQFFLDSGSAVASLQKPSTRRANGACWGLVQAEWRPPLLWDQRYWRHSRRGGLPESCREGPRQRRRWRPRHAHLTRQCRRRNQDRRRWRCQERHWRRKEEEEVQRQMRHSLKNTSWLIWQLMKYDYLRINWTQTIHFLDS